jgi:hypothetical protein
VDKLANRLVDPGTTDDVKRALIEGASWCNQAFEATGFRKASKVDVLPPDFDGFQSVSSPAGGRFGHFQ